MNQNQPNTLPPDYFDHVYQANRDPWNFETSPYEREKYAATLAALPRPHYAKAFEIGCSLGVLTAQLAPRCGHLLAVDVSEAALAQARARCAALPQVEIQQHAGAGGIPGSVIRPDSAVGSGLLLVAGRPGPRRRPASLPA